MKPEKATAIAESIRRGLSYPDALARYNLIALEVDSAEAQHPERYGDRGETYGPKGNLLATLPGSTIPCTGPLDSKGKHHRECLCAGSGLISLRQDHRTDMLEPADDSLRALIEAADEAKAEAAEKINAFWGTANGAQDIMRRDVVLTGKSSGSKGRKRAKVVKRTGEKPPEAFDGRIERTGKPVHKQETDWTKAVIATAETLKTEAAEARRALGRPGRKTRFGGPARNSRLSTSVLPDTIATLREQRRDLPHLIAAICAEEPSKAILAELRAAATIIVDDTRPAVIEIWIAPETAIVLMVADISLRKFASDVLQREQQKQAFVAA